MLQSPPFVAWVYDRGDGVDVYIRWEGSGLRCLPIRNAVMSNDFLIVGRLHVSGDAHRRTRLRNERCHPLVRPELYIQRRYRVRNP